MGPGRRSQAALDLPKIEVSREPRHGPARPKPTILQRSGRGQPAYRATGPPGGVPHGPGPTPSTLWVVDHVGTWASRDGVGRCR
jgi:hypothetical protein